MPYVWNSDDHIAQWRKNCHSCRLFLTIFLSPASCFQSRAPRGWCWCCCLSNLLPTYFLRSCLISSYHIMITINRLPATWKCHQLYRICRNMQPLKVCLCCLPQWWNGMSPHNVRGRCQNKDLMSYIGHFNRQIEWESVLQSLMKNMTWHGWSRCSASLWENYS